MKIPREELKRCGDTICEEGYRVIHYYRDGNYSVGSWAKTLPDFMYGMDEYEIDDILLEFKSVEDLLEKQIRYVMKFDDIIGIAIYDLDGNCIGELYK